MTLENIMRLADEYASNANTQWKTEQRKSRAALSTAIAQVIKRAEGAEADATRLRQCLGEWQDKHAGLQAERDANAKDAARLDWLESSKESHGFCHTGYGDYRHYAFQMEGFTNVRETIDAARDMKGQQ